MQGKGGGWGARPGASWVAKPQRSNWSSKEKVLQAHQVHAVVWWGWPKLHLAQPTPPNPRTLELFQSSHALAHHGHFADRKTESRGGKQTFPRLHGQYMADP